MPPEALALALAASIYPPAVAAVIALGRGEQLRSRVFAFVLAAAMITYAVGVLLLVALVDLGVSGVSDRTPGAAVDLVLGVLLLGLARRLHRRRNRPPKPVGESKIERYLRSRRLAFVLGITLYVLPSPIYIAAVKAVADGESSTGARLASLAATVAVMLWLIELPMLLLLATPERAADALERINLWFGRNWRIVAIAACLGAGVYLIVKGILTLGE
ncbi:MAG TPA: GAP family protein [Solirubrobacteraceae bacterium]|nr:GAP family protein [Solirubrobacteraceae bacterium]